MQLERVLTDLPPAERLREVDFVEFQHKVFEDIKYGHLYIVIEAVTKQEGKHRRIMRLTNL